MLFFLVDVIVVRELICLNGGEVWRVYGFFVMFVVFIMLNWKRNDNLRCVRFDLSMMKDYDCLLCWINYFFIGFCFVFFIVFGVEMYFGMRLYGCSYVMRLK